MYSGLVFVLLHSILSIIPGLGWAVALNYKRIYLLAFSLSTAMPVLSVFIAKTLDLTPNQGTIIWIVLALMGWLVAYRKIKDVRIDFAILPYIIITILWVCYSLWAGAYIDVPGDFIFHTRFIEANLEAQQQGAFIANPSLWSKQNFYGHYLWAFELNLLNVEAWHVYPYMAFINALLFFFGIYSAGVWIFESGRLTHFVAMPLALFATIFSSFLFSVDAFSFARYYFIAPVITTFIGFLTAGLIGTAAIRGQGNWVRDTIVIVIISTWLLLAHRQELLFVIIMLLIVLVIEAIRTDANSERKYFVRSLAWSSVAIAFALWVTVYIYGQRNGITTNKIIPLENILPFVKNLYIANPTYQFYQVLGPTGILTMLVLWLVRRDWWDNTWLFAAWLSPFITLFNPLFVDFFLRQASEHLLWRLSFLTQLYYLFSLALFILGRRVLSTQFTMTRRALCAIALAVLMVSLVPMQSRYWNFAPNRFLGLADLDQDTTPNHWDDLWIWLYAQPVHEILTDPYTGYQVASFTQQSYSGYKFFNDESFKEYRFANYSDNPLQRFNGAWLVINMRDGGYSEMGDAVGHWDAESLYTSQWYPAELLIHITAQPDHFVKQWQSEDGLIGVYEIKY